MEFEHSNGLTTITQMDDLSLKADQPFASASTLSGADVVANNFVNATGVNTNSVNTGSVKFPDGTSWNHGSKSVTQSANLIHNGAMVRPVTHTH